MTQLICKTGKEVEIPENVIIDLERTYKSIDVRQQLEIMRQWCLANPQKRKTERGLMRFVNTWLNKANQETAAGRPIRIQGIKPMGIDNVTDVSWLDGDQKQAKSQQYLKQHGQFWDGERVTA